MTAPTEPFVGRERELDVIHGAFERTCTRGASLVLVEGAAGFGKSALLRRVEADFDGRATPVRVTGLEDEKDLPFAVLSQLRAALQVSAPEVPLHRLELRDPWEAGAELLRLAAEYIGGPVLLLVDDLHWCDVESMKAFTFVFRRLGAAPLLGVGSLRPGPSGADPMVRLAQSEGTIVRLEGLRSGEIVELGCQSGRVLSPAVAVELQRTTRGSPLHVRALLDEFDDRDLASVTLPAPREFGLVVEAQLARIGPAARRLIDVVAILGVNCRLDHAGLVSRLASTELAATTEAAASDGLLELAEQPDGLALRFSHPLVRAAVHDRISPEARVEYHRRAAEVITGVAGLDHAVLASLGPDDDLAQRLVEAASADVIAGASAAAARRFRQAARLVSSDSLRTGYLLDAVEQLLQAGDAAQAREVLELTDPAGQPLRRRYLRGVLALAEGRVDVATADLTSVWTDAERPAEGLLAACAAEQLSRVVARSGQGAITALWSQRCLDDLGDDGPVTMVAQAERRVAWGHAVAGRVDDAEAAMAAWDALPVATAASGGSRRLVRGLVRLLSDRPTLAARDLRVVAGPTSAVTLRDRTSAMVSLANAEFHTGHWDDALRHAEVARSLAIEGDLAAIRPMTRAVMAVILVGRGELDEARELLEQSEPDEHVDLVTGSAWASAAALAGLSAGDHRAVVQACAGMPVANAGIDGDEPPVFAWPLLLCEALLALGSTEAADECLERFLTVTPSAARPLTTAVGTKVRAMVEAARGRAGAAEAAFAEAAEILDGSELVFEQARLADARGRFRVRIGDIRTGADHFDEAVRLYDLLGAVRFGDDARQVRDLLRGTISSGSADTPRLTAKEVAVVTLVAAGRSNREISDELFVTVKTVEYHLGNVFAKVGVRSRTELAAWWHAGHPTTGAAPALRRG